MTEEEIIHELRRRWITKEELCVMLECSERGARAYTEELTQKLIPFGTCVLSTAARKGYHIPDINNPEDVELARTAVNELKSKAVSIFERRKAIDNFLERIPKKDDLQLSLF